jgi:two-component system sensor histidine kinase ResE
MEYQILIDGEKFFDGNIINVFLLFTVLVIAIIVTIIFITKRLRENNHMKYEFITIVAHKFRTPLTYIKWVCDSLIPDETDSFKKKSLEDVKKSNQKIIDLTSTLIEIADAESSGGATYVFEKVSAYDFVKDISDRFKDTIHEKNLFFSLNCDKKDALIKIDKSRLEFVISTMIENACIYTPPGQNISINIGVELFKVYISIQDSGIGISKKDLPHIFSKFYRGKNARNTDTEGFGVGLYLASSIVRRLGGKVSVFSEGEGRGSTFTVILPKAR